MVDLSTIHLKYDKYFKIRKWNMVSMTTGSEFLVEHKEFDPHAGQLLITRNIQSIVAVSALSAFPTIAAIVQILY